MCNKSICRTSRRLPPHPRNSRLLRKNLLLPHPQPPPPAALQPGVHQAKEVIVDTPLYHAVFTEQGARVKSFRLKRFWDRLPFQKIADFSLWMFNIDIQKYMPLGEITDPKEMIHSNNPEMLPLGMTWQAAAGSIGPDEIYTGPIKKSLPWRITTRPASPLPRSGRTASGW